MKKRFYALLILIIIFTINGNAFAGIMSEDDGELIFELFDRESGLSNLSVSSIIQDKYGYLWFGTQGGVNRFDGKNFKVYRNKPFDEFGLIHNLIQTMYYDEEKHELWIGTYQGVSNYKIDEDTFINYTLEDGLSDPVVTSIEKASNGDIWIGTLNGLNRLSSDGSIKQYSVDANVVRCVIEAENNTIFIGTYNGLYTYDSKNDVLVQYKTDLKSTYVMTIKEFTPGILTIGLWDGGILLLDYEQNISKSILLEDNRVYSIEQTYDGIIWAGTYGGGLFGIVNEKPVYKYNIENSDLNNNVIYSLFEDHSQVLWIGTNGGGLFKSNPRHKNYVIYHHEDDESSLSSGKITEMYEDKNNLLWIAIYDNGINIINQETGQINKFINDETDLESLPDNLIVDIIELDEDSLIMGTASGLVMSDVNSFVFKKTDLIPNDIIVYALEKEDENNIWVGTYGQGLYLANIISGELEIYSTENNSLSDDLIYDVYKDSKNRLWVATNDGLNLKQSDENSFEVYYKDIKNRNSISSNVTQLIFEDQQDRIWVGTDGGGISLYLENGQFKNFTEEEGLASNTVVGILEDFDGRIVVSTGSGISVINPETEEIISYTPDDGIGSWEFNPGHIKTKDGKLLFSGYHGITNFQINQNGSYLHEPHLYITSVKLFQSPLEEHTERYNNRSFSFDADENYFSFDFIAVDYDAPSKTNYVYKLEGFDNDWNYSQNINYVNYSNLPPGSYTFKVYAENSRRVKSDIATVSIVIANPWFKAWYGYFIYGLIFTIAVIIIIKLRELNLIGKKNKELADVNDKLEDANERLEALSIVDPLTGIYNRRYLEKELNERLLIAKRSNINITILMIDIDDFKNINDTYGHLVGDHLLEDIANVFVSTLPRKTDFVARYGGDEFTVVLYDTDLNGSLDIANKLIGSTNGINLRGLENDEIVKTEISIGLLCEIPRHDSNIETMIEKADQCLYKAKSAGGNSVYY